MPSVATLAPSDTSGRPATLVTTLSRVAMSVTLRQFAQSTSRMPTMPVPTTASWVCAAVFNARTAVALHQSMTGLSVTVSSAILPDGLWGCYDASNSVILIDRRLTYTAKRCVLTHELLHWKHGDDGCANDRSKQERRCRTQTALLLVNPAELALLERMYEYEWQIADELNVTTQVSEDYRRTITPT